MQLPIQIIGNMIVIMGISYYLPGIVFEGTWWHLVIAGLLIGAFNFLLKQLIGAIWDRYLFITLGIFTLAANTAIFLLIAYAVPGFSLGGFWPAFWSISILTLTNYSIHSIMGYSK